MYRHRITVTKDNSPKRKKPWLVRWYGEFNICTGSQKRFCKSFARKVDAENHARQLEEDFDAGMSKAPQIITLKKLCDDFISTKSKRVKFTTLKNYQNTIDRLLNYFHPQTHIEKIDGLAAGRYINELVPVAERLKFEGLFRR